MVSIFKLIDGTEIIGHVSKEYDSEVMIDNPMQINYKIRSDSLVPVVSMLRYMPFALDPKTVIKKDHILSKADPMNGLVKYYESSIKSLQDSETDKAIDEEFHNAANGELTEEMQIKLAMMEKAALKTTLN